MISESALAEALLTCGIAPFQRMDHTVWLVPGETAQFHIRSPVLPPIMASWLRSQCVAMGDAAVLERYNHIALRLDATAVWTGLAWQGDYAVIACCMVALERWSEEYALLALGMVRTLSEHEPDKHGES